MKRLFLRWVRWGQGVNVHRGRLIGGAVAVVGAATALLVSSGVVASLERPDAPPPGARARRGDEPTPAPRDARGVDAALPELEPSPTPDLANATPDEALVPEPEREPARPERAFELAYEGNNLLVLDRGRPVEGVEVRLYDPRLVGGAPVEVAVSDAQGLVRFAHEEGAVRVIEGPPPRFVSPGEAGAFDLSDPAEYPLEGQVVGPEGEPVADAAVSLSYGAFALSAARSDGSGRFVLSAPGSDGTLVVAAEGYQPARLGLDLLRKQAGVVRLLRGERGALGGTVVDDAERPLAGVLVRATSGTGAFLLCETDSFGRFGFEHLPAGPIVLQVHRGELVPVTQQTAEVRARDVTEVLVRVRARGVLALRVHGNGQALPDVDVRLRAAGVTRFGNFEADASNQTGRSDAEGWVRFEVPPGGYHLRVAVDGEDHLASGAVEAGVTTELELDVLDRRSLSVHVTDPQGNPVPGVFMDVSLPGIDWSGMPSTRTDAQGVGRFEQLPHGLAEVHLGRGGLWRMARSAGERVDFVWTEGQQLRLQGRVLGGGGRLLALTVRPDVARMHALEAPGGDLDATLDVPAGPQSVLLVPADQGLAPVLLGAVPSTGELSGFEVSFPRAGIVRGRLQVAGHPTAGRVVLGGVWGAAQEARVQWSTGTDHDSWITVNEWAQASGPDGVFALGGLAPGTHALELSAIGARPRSLTVEVAADGAVDLGALELEPAE
ncbi:MAG: carboxypeptidase regulatory-like domain-containing protein [Planctomycetota bacterium]